MLAEAKGVVLPEGGDSMVVYEGFLTQLVQQKLSLSVPYYTSVRRALMNMGCIRQLRRGGGTSPSQWELITEPTLEAFESQQPEKKVTTSKTGLLEQQVVALTQRVNDIEETMEELVHAWAKFFGAEKAEE